MNHELYPANEIEKALIETLEPPEMLEHTRLSVSDLIALWKQKDLSTKITSVLETWEKQQKEERGLRKTYAYIFVTILMLQLVAINFAFLMLASGKISLDHWTIRIFIVSVFGEISGMTYVVLRYLFPPSTSDKMFDLIKEIGH